MSQRSGNFRLSEGNPMGDDWEQLQDVLMWTQNRRVLEEFRDVSPPEEEWVANLRTPRARLRWACTLKDTDSAIMVLSRLWLFYVIMGQAAAFQGPIFGIPVTGFQEARKYQPQIQLYFVEDWQDVDEGYSPVSGQISFRLPNFDPETSTEAQANTLALRVRSAFASGNGFVWKKGKVMVSYTDRTKGYALILLCRSASEGRRVIEQVLDIQQDAPDWSKMNVSENQSESERYPIIPRTQRILGRTRRGPRQRPVADVRFQHATLHIWGLPNPLVLVDRSRTFRNPLVEV